LNKNTKIWLNYTVGAAISLILLYSIYGQVKLQLQHLDKNQWQHTGAPVFLYLCVALMFVNTSLEGYKWHLLAGEAGRHSYRTTFGSYLAGVAISIVTPNRTGEYPGRILYLNGGNTFRYINVSVLGVLTQLSGIYICGLAGLIYYNMTTHDLAGRIGLAFCIGSNICLSFVYMRFERWVPKMERIPWLRKFALYGRLARQIPKEKQKKIWMISLLRSIIFTAQYLFLLRWFNVVIPLAEGFCLSALFFWAMAVIPTIALTELGIRGSVSLHIFNHYSTNSIGILGATTGIWLLNLMIPAIIGSLLILRMRILR
jgi:Lysylphosphatidylglycerol synthase TM region